MFVIQIIISFDTIHIVNYTEKTQKNEDREYLDSKTGTYKLREYRPKSPDTPKLREYKPKFKEVKVREYVPKSHVTGNQYVTLREYDHTYEVEPPDDDDDRRMVCLVLMLSCGDPIKNLRGGRPIFGNFVHNLLNPPPQTPSRLAHCFNVSICIFFSKVEQSSLELLDCNSFKHYHRNMILVGH